MSSIAISPDPSAAPLPTETVFETRRLVLREFGPGDEADILALHAEERSTSLLLDGAVRTAPEAALFVRWLAIVYRRHPGLGIWRASTKDDNAFGGFFSLMPLPGTADVEIGARLMPRLWGRRFALEGGRELLRHAFVELGLPRVAGLSHPANRPVRFVLQQLGFRFEGTQRHYDRDALVYGLERSAWETASATSIGRACRVRVGELPPAALPAARVSPSCPGAAKSFSSH